MRPREIERIVIECNQDWHIAAHELFDITPDQAMHYSAEDGDEKIWTLYFIQDLLQIKHRQDGRLLDVGWYPDSEPNGAYRLVLLEPLSETGKEGGWRYDWRSPIYEFKTRSLDELKSQIERTTVQPNK